MSVMHQVTGVTVFDIAIDHSLSARLGFEAQKGAMSFGFDLGALYGADDTDRFYGQVALKYAF